jgi:hypothetical protein
MLFKFDLTNLDTQKGYFCETCLKNKYVENFLIPYGDIICGIRLKNMHNISYLKLCYNNHQIQFNNNLDHIKFFDDPIIKMDFEDGKIMLNAYPAIAIKHHDIMYEIDGEADVYFDCIQICDKQLRKILVNSKGTFSICGKTFIYGNGMFSPEEKL